MIYWIDDDPTRKEDSDNLGARINVPTKFWNLYEKDIAEEVNEILSQKQPTLILIDHSLVNTTNPILKKGSTVSQWIREEWPMIPIHCVTSSDPKEINHSSSRAYESIIQFNELSKNDEFIKSCFEGFSKLNDIPKNKYNSEMYCGLLEPNDDEIEKLKSILPHELKDENEATNDFVIFYKWVFEDLISKPGFLLDALYTATMLGLTPKGFEKIKDKFEEVRYRGIFNTSSNATWWKNGVLETLSTLVDGNDLPWVLGRKLYDFEKDDLSKCEVSTEDYPDTVALSDTTKSATRHQVLTKYTKVHPHFESMLYFDDIRIINK